MAIVAEVAELDRRQARILGVAGDGGIVERRRKLRQVGERLAEFAVPRFEQVVAGNAERRRGGVVCFEGDAAAGDDDRALGRRTRSEASRVGKEGVSKWRT